jgi:hypothetical protein
MKSARSLFSRIIAALICAFTLDGSLSAQSSKADASATPGNSAKPSIPTADTLVLQGQVTTAAEAKPLIDQYYAEQEQFFQERRAALISAKDKSPEEQLKIMRAVVAAQRERRQKNRDLEARVSAMLKQDREANGSDKKNAANDGR